MTPGRFLLLNVALAFYDVGIIWAHEVDIFRSWKLVDAETFHGVQDAHWRKLPYWVFAPVGLSLVGSIALLGYRPPGSPLGWPMSALVFQLASHALTAAFWGRWQAKLSQDPLGPRSPYLSQILSTHWIRTGLINAYAWVLLVWSLSSLKLQ